MEDKEVHDEKLYVRIHMDNIRFSDSYEQNKFERLKDESQEKAIQQVETLLARQTFMISFD